MAPQPSQPARGYAAVARGRPAGVSKVGRPRTVAPATTVSTSPLSFTPSDRSIGMPSQAETTSRVAQLKTMGFSEESARHALVAYAWDVNKALDSLLMSGDQSETVASTAAASTKSAKTSSSKPACFGSSPSDIEVRTKRPDPALATKRHAKESGDLLEKASVEATAAVLEISPQALPQTTVDQPVSAVQTAGQVGGNSMGEHNTRQAELLPQAQSSAVLCHDAPMRTQMSSGIMQLKMMGFSESAAKQALVTHAWDVNKALDGLLAQGAFSSTVSDVGVALAVDSTSGTLASDPIFHSTASDMEVVLNNDRIEQNIQESAKDKDDLLEDSFSTLDLSSGASPRSSIERQNDAKHTHEAASTMSSDSSQEEEVLLGVPEATLEAASGAQFQSMQTLSATSDVIDDASNDVAPSVCKNEPCGAPAQIPRKEVFRVKLSWLHDSSSDQLGVEEGDFVLAWPNTKTENGWIYAENIGGAGCAGWVPSTVLQEPPCDRKWMCATRSWDAHDERQMGVQEGKVFSLYVNSRTELGWVYAEVADEYKLCANTDSISLLDESGWVPDYCFDWPTV